MKREGAIEVLEVYKVYGLWPQTGPEKGVFFLDILENFSWTSSRIFLGLFSCQIIIFYKIVILLQKTQILCITILQKTIF